MPYSYGSIVFQRIQPYKRRWRFHFKKPEHLDGGTFGFLFRFLLGFASVSVGFVLLFWVGAITKWQLYDWMLYGYALFIALMVFFGEIIRVSLYERILIIRELRLLLKSVA